MVNVTEQKQTQPTNKKRVLIVDDHPILRKGLSMMINQEPDLVVCGEAEDAHKAMELIERVKPDMVIVDISLPGVDGVELLKNIRTRFGDLPALVVSMHDESLFAERALRAGARGYIMKQEALDDVLTAIRRVLNGEIFVSSKITTRMLEKLVEADVRKGNSPLDLLSDRELTVLRLIGQGLGTRQIADNLHLSVKTIESYRMHLKEKLKLTSGTDLLKYAIQWVQNNP
ncbi:MAG TPA: DNA-binding response regulator [Deltaproteobacteria bacterium]|nr:DNA-binding response regulator [Deltaproteobacteria bacterium]